MAKDKGLLFLTVPPEYIPSRRRDPFGFADIANYYSDLLAPGITNRNRDARWLTILCWSLDQIDKDFRNNDTDDYYNYLRGLELRWVMETCRLADEGKGRHLPGSRAVRRWLKSRAWSLQDQMGKDQWRRYRYVGPYASYRRLLQEIGLLDADGWTPIGDGPKLAKLIRPNLKDNTNKATDGSWVDYWLRRWPEKEKPQIELIPKSARSLRLTKAEIGLIEPLIFGDSIDGKRRRTIAKAMAKIKADNHAEMCLQIQRHLLKVSSSWPEEEKAKFEKLSTFAFMADAAVTALQAAFMVAEEPMSVRDVTKKVAVEIDALKESVKNWKKDNVWTRADSFALEIAKAKRNSDCLTSLVNLHIERHSGLKWLILQSDNLDRAVRYSAPPYGFYRFRLEALARMAVGCGVIEALPSPFIGETAEGEDE